MKAFLASAIFACAVVLSSADTRGQDLIPGTDPDLIPAQIVNTPRVTPPQEAIDSGLGGNVRVKISIDDAGNVITADDVSGPGAVCRHVTRADVVAMRKAAREAAMLARFTPATLNGKPIASSTWLNFDFPASAAKSELTFQAASPPDGKRYTIKAADPNFSAATPPPPDYIGPVNTADASDAEKSLPKQIVGGVLNGKATSLPKPAYPPAARAVRAAGAVSVQVLIDENGEVFSAQAMSGHPLLRSVSTIAACDASFSPTRLSGVPVKVSGIITYNFVP